mgnify:CR=1 FL=1
MTTSLPDSIQDTAQLETLLSEPTPGVVEAMGRLEGDLMLLGAGGKMGPTMARMAKRASDAAGNARRVIAVSRFSAPGVAARLQEQGVEVRSCDLLDMEALNALPDVANIVYIAGMKFGTTGQEPLTWAMNTALPTLVSHRFPGVNLSAMSTGNVYGLSSVALGGAKETDPLDPVGEYAMSALGRERIFEYYAQQHHTPTAMIRLYYAVELRYGVPVDVARRIWEGASVDLSMGYASIIWQRDANAHTLQALEHTGVPARPINVSGSDIVRLRDLATCLGQHLDREPIFTGTESETALVCDTTQSQKRFGKPTVDLDTMCRWIADWVKHGRENLGKPTHFEDRQGKF